MTGKSTEYKSGYAQATADWAELLERTLYKCDDLPVTLHMLITALQKQAKEWQRETLK